MKNNLLSFSFILFTCIIFSNTSFAQKRDAGFSGNGFCNPQPIPESFKRNNGEGTCGDNGQIRLKFNEHPTEAPILIGLLYEDGTPIENIILPIEGDMSPLDKKGYISYCMVGGNIDPAKKIIAVFHYPGGCQDDAIVYQK